MLADSPPNRRAFLRSTLAGSAAALAADVSFSAQESVPIPQGKVRVLLDTDTYNEIDDQFALAYGLLSPEHMEIEAIYAGPFVNSRAGTPADGMQQSYDEILEVLDLLEMSDSRPVLKGSREWMPAADKPVDSPAARDMIERVMAADGDQLYIVALGAPTNVSSALLMEPRLVERATVVWLGARPYNFPTTDAYNLRQDMHATRLLFDSGVKLLNTPGPGVCENLRTTEGELAHYMKGKSKIGDYLFELFVEYQKERRPSAGFPYSKPIWDVVPMAWLVNPAWVESVLAPSPILTDDKRWHHDPYRHQVRVAIRILRDPIFHDMFTKLAQAPS